MSPLGTHMIRRSASLFSTAGSTHLVQTPLLETLSSVPRAALGAAVVLTTIAGAAHGQVPYVSTQFGAPFVPLTGGQLAQVASPDDGAALVPLGFSFNYHGVDYTHLNVGVNGVANLAQTCAVGCEPFSETCEAQSQVCERTSFPFNPASIPSTTAPQQVIAPFWDDLHLRPGTMPAAEILYATTGVAPNREFTVEWRNIRHIIGAMGSDSKANFQIRLFEASGLIWLHYGAFDAGMDLMNWSGLIGAENATGTEATHPLACAMGGFCDYTVLAGLEDQVLQIGPLVSAELLGSVAASTGGNPGDPIEVAVTVRNIGTESSSVAFSADVYFTANATISPGTDTLLGSVSFAVLGPMSTVTGTLAASVPAGAAPGYYTIGAVIDPLGLVDEATDANNTVVSPSRFLVGSEMSVAMDPVVVAPPGQPSAITFRIINSGAAVASAGWELYLSDNTMLDATDVLLSSGSTPLAATPETTVTASTTLPAVMPGNYYVIARVDPQNLIPEADEMNNTGASDVFLIGAELTVAVSGPARSGPNEPVSVNVELINSGSEVADVEWAVYVSQDQTLDQLDALVVTGTAALGRLRSLPVVATATLPAIAPVDHYFIAVIDPNDAIPEVDETNNVSASATRTEMVGPDIVAVEVGGDARAFRGGSYAITATIRNEGGATARDFYYSFHLSDNQLITVTDELLGEFGPFTLRSGEVLNVRETVTVSSSISAGLYYLGLIADSTSAVLEELENNNIKRWQQQQVEVRDPAPDFVVSQLTVPPLGASGEVIPAQRTLENQGNAFGTAPYAIYLSEDSVFDPMVDRMVGMGSKMLTAFAVDEDVDVVRIPADTPAGTYWIVYALDPTSMVDELDEMNNVTVSSGSLAIEAAELTILTRTLPLATIDLPYEVVLAARGGSGQYQWSVSDGELPPGLSINASTGQLLGTPSSEGEWMLTIAVTDGSLTTSRMYGLLVTGPTVALEALTRGLPPAWVGRRYEYPLTALGGVQPYTWSADGILPDGLTLSSEGLIAGVPEAPGSGIISFRVEDATGAFDERPLALRVINADDAVRFRTDVLNDGEVGKAYDEQLHAVNGVSPYTFSFSGGDLPPGLSLEGDQIIGVPTKIGRFGFWVRVTDNRGDFDVNRYVVSITAEEGVRFVTNALPPARVGADYLDEGGNQIRVKAISPAGNDTIRYVVTVGDLPAGIELDADGLLHGTPTANGVFDFLVMATDGQEETDVAAFGIVVLAKDEGMQTTPPTVDPEGCTCTTAPADQGGAWLLGMMLLVGLAVLKRRSAAVAAALAIGALGVVVAPAPAQAQTVPYFLSTYAEAYVNRTGGMPMSFSGQDDGQATVPLPFMFKYFDDEYSEIRISTNGFGTFLNQQATDFSNDGIPNSSDPNALIALFWDDLYGPTGSVYVEGTAPTRVVIVQLENVGHFGDRTAQLNFQLWLHEGPAGRFEIHYGPISNVNGTLSGTMGFESPDGSTGHTFLPCGQNGTCSLADLQAQTGQVHRAMQDGGEDVTAGQITAPSLVYAGVPFDVTMRVISLHQNPIGPFSYRVHLVSPGDVVPNNPIFTSSPITLMAYENREVTESVAFPLMTPTGRFRVALEVDAHDDIAEPDETNNIRVLADEIVVAERRPDFTITSVSVGVTEARPGDMLTATVQLRNAGNLAGSADWRLVVSPNRVISVDDIGVHDARVTLAPLTAQTASVSFTLPAALNPGRFWIGAVIDPDNDVLELNEINNAGGIADAIAVGVDFVDVVTELLPGGYLGLDYSTYLRGSGGDGNYTWSLDSGDLPDGLGLVGSSGELRGVPTSVGTSVFDVKVESAGLAATKTLRLEIRALDTGLTIVTRALLPGLVGQDYPPHEVGTEPAMQQHIITAGGGPNVVFSLGAPAPAGIELDADGYLHGVPTRRGTFDLALVATDGTDTASRTVPLTIAEPGRLSLVAAVLPDAVIEEAYQFRLQVLGASATASVSFTLVGGPETLPAGLALTQDGLIVGSPAEITTRHFAVEVVEGSGAAAPRDTANFFIRVVPDAGFGITPSTLPAARIGEAYDAALEARGGTAPFAWRVNPTTTIPRGLRWEIDTTGGRERVKFLGTPEALPDEGGDTPTGGLATFLVGVEDSVGRSTSLSLSIRVLAAAEPPPITGEGGSCVCVRTEGEAPWAGGGLALGLVFVLFVRRRLRPVR